MAISLLRKSFKLLVHVLLFVCIVPRLAATECRYGQYSSDGRCYDCSPCFKDVILGTSQQYAPLYECKQYTSLCPNWCSVESASRSNPDEGRDVCPPTTPAPPVPQVNITIEEPRYNSTANAYTVSCTVSFRDMGIPTLKWYGPSGQLLAPTDTSDKWKVTEGVVTQEVISTTLLMKDFQEGDEGNYVCAAQGEQSDNRTILLEYVEPPLITSTLPPTTPPSPSSIKPKPTPGESDTPKESGLSTLWIIVGVLVGVFLCGICAFLILKQRLTRRGRTQRSIEAHPLVTTNYLVDRLILETSDFISARVKGIQACLDQPNCDAVIIKQNGKKIGKVHSNQDTFPIKSLAWNDSIEVWMKYSHKNIFLLKYFQQDNELIKTMKMKCLKIRNIAETSARISCPSIENTFYMRFEEKNAGGSSGAGLVKLMCGGSREICDLRPSVTYCVQLGIKGQTGDSGDYKWVWNEEFTTRSITVQSVKPSKTSAKVTLSVQTNPESVLYQSLYYEINQAEREPMTSAQISISPLIPGMEQVLQIKVKENVGGITAYRLLQEKTFTTSGSVDNGGDYEGCATTDCAYLDPGPSKGRRKKPSRKNVPTKCNTGLLEAIRNLPNSDSEKSIQVYRQTPQCVLEAVLESLLEFLKDHKDFIPRDKYVLNVKGKQRGMENIEGFISMYSMQDYTGVFDLLRRFIRNEKVHTPDGVTFAEQLLHCSEHRSCDLCNHAVFLLRRYQKRRSHQPSVC